MLKYIYFLFSILLVSESGTAQTWQTRSGEKQTAVLELFTSEGCRLCPAADRWVHGFAEQGLTEDKVIVLGFHIDYLNSKGWIDRFSDPVFSHRQRAQAKINLFDTVYTPEFFVSGEVIHNWEKHVKKVIHAVNNFQPEAKIKLSVKQEKASLAIQSQVEVEGADNRRYSQYYLAITEDNIKSEVTGGDNQGMTFLHQNLVRAWLGPFALDKTGTTRLTTAIQLLPEWQCDNLNIVALVQNSEDGFVLQGVKLALTQQEN